MIWPIWRLFSPIYLQLNITSALNFNLLYIFQYFKLYLPSSGIRSKIHFVYHRLLISECIRHQSWHRELPIINNWECRVLRLLPNAFRYEAMLQVYYGSNTLNVLGNHVINNLIHAQSFLNTTLNSSHNDKMEKNYRGDRYTNTKLQLVCDLYIATNAKTQTAIIE